jgi:hypothetical protein
VLIGTRRARPQTSFGFMRRRALTDSLKATAVDTVHYYVISPLFESLAWRPADHCTCARPVETLRVAVGAASPAVVLAEMVRAIGGS